MQGATAVSKDYLNWPLTVFQAYQDNQQPAHLMSSSNSVGSENETLTGSKQPIIE